MTSPPDSVRQSMPVTGEDTIAESAIQAKVIARDSGLCILASCWSNALSQVLRIRHSRSSSPAVLRCAVVCALLVCVGVAQGERKIPPLVLALNTCLAARDVLSCCCIRTQTPMPIDPSGSILLYLMNRSTQPQYAITTAKHRRGPFSTASWHQWLCLLPLYLEIFEP